MTPRSKSLLFSATLVLLSASALGAAAVSTNGLLVPFRDGKEWASERSLSASTRSLSVLATTLVDGEPQFLPGVRVEVRRSGVDGVVASGATGPDGRAVFELAQGASYLVAVAAGNVASAQETPLEEDERLGVHIVDGEAHWRRIPHAVLEQAGDLSRLFVRFQDRSRCGEPQSNGEVWGMECPAEASYGLAVTVYTVHEGVRAAQVASYTSGDPADDPMLPPGEYEVEMRHGDQVAVERILLLRCDFMVMALLAEGLLSVESECLTPPAA